MGPVHFGRLPDGTRRARAKRRACAVLAAAALAPLPAAAQQQAHPLMTAEIVDTLSVRNDADMDFGGIIPSGNTGTVVMTPSASPSCATTGGLVHTGACKAAVFVGFAFATADLRVQRPAGNSINLTGPGGATMQLNAFTFGATGTTVSLGQNGANHRFRIDALDGAFLFYVGGTLNVAATQAPGIYNGSFDIRVSYN
jgi:hypothetical protein